MAFHSGRTRVWRAICEHLQDQVGPDADVVELGAGYCDFINNIQGRTRVAVDRDSIAREMCAPGVRFVQSDVTVLDLPSESADVVFASNLLEHLTDDQLAKLFDQLAGVLRPAGKIILLQPNYYYCYRTYWDDYTHVKAFSHVSLCDYLVSKNYQVKLCVPRFLPFSFHSRLPKSYWLTKLYLLSPLRPMGAQMLVVAERRPVADVQR
jgi:SAM-dependent methyltransferase